MRKIYKYNVMFRKSLKTFVLGSLLSSSCLLLTTTLVAATTVTSKNQHVFKQKVGQPPLVIYGIVPTGTFYLFNAHPPGFAIDIGFKSLTHKYEDDATFGPDIHGTDGSGQVRSELEQDAGGNLTFISSVRASIFPGLAENLPVSMTVALSDPLTIGPGFTNFSTFDLDVFLSSGTKFDGIPRVPSIADNPKISLNARVAPGEISDPFNFFNDSIADAIDLYQIEIEQSNSSGLIEPTISLGTSNSFFSLSFSDSNDVIEQRIVNAFSGNAGNYEVLNDQFLFSLTLEPTQENLVYTFGDKSEAFAPNVEVPEPLTILGSATALGFGAFFKRKLKSSKTSEKETINVG
jgi:hypothetical protein